MPFVLSPSRRRAGVSLCGGGAYDARCGAGAVRGFAAADRGGGAGGEDPGVVGAAAELSVHVCLRGDGAGGAAAIRAAAVVPEAEPVPAGDARALSEGDVSGGRPRQYLHAGGRLAGAPGGDRARAAPAGAGAPVPVRV